MIKLNKYNDKLTAIYEELDDLIGKLEEKTLSTFFTRIIKTTLKSNGIALSS